MANAVVAVFDEYNEAQSTVNELLVAGFDKSEVRLSAEEESAARLNQDREPEAGLKGFFNRLFGTDDRDDIRLYDEAVRHGNYVVTAIAATDEKSEIASEVMSHHHPLDLDERSSEWLGSEAQESGGISAGEPIFESDESRSIPVIEEEVKIGKREVQRGGVRIFQRVSEVPIEEDITLREEQIVVERIPVDKPATDADLGAFKEGSAELRERSEEAVVSKKARVVEEVRVGKQVTQRKEKIRETARRTDVDVERTGAWNDQYRQHWQQNYGALGSWEDFAPAYEYGSTAASSTLYQGRDWDAVEPELRSDWESRYPGSAWDRFKDSIRHAFGGGSKY
ncbi:MAG: YsnF/AvaK domain-containing protein [Archangium sp.]|nr:YsnF/AvaK domain-containing protein [Archangium sp.]MDP3153357.1 YsnF/AvaK domain-containing protein [Archangium sp.]MDP3573485.1 YsnF/AvaK domain-containing protein [Archangium sp.]